MKEKKERSRTQKAKLNMMCSLLQQGVSLICGLILPRMIIGAFGSEINGATASITTFLSYIVLLEGGIGAVTRSSLYKALASKSDEQISAVVNETKSFYRKIAAIFVVYVLIIALFFNKISHNVVFDYWYSFSLVLIISLSTFAEYFIGISYSLLLQADQIYYIPSLFKTAGVILNTVGAALLISLNCDILAVKLLSSTLFAIRPILLSLYVKKRYRLSSERSSERMLQQKGSAIGQHIAWSLHNNTDVTVLTLFKDLSLVSVYSVYNMISAQLQNLLNAFTTGMEAVFGDMLARHEEEKLKRTFGYYETLSSVLCVTVFSVAAVLIVSFVRLYTAGITDVEYSRPFFGVVIMISALLFCLRTPYASVIIAAGHFRQTQWAAYGEVAVNIILSIILVVKYDLNGVAVGTAVATLFRTVYYVVYLSKELLHRPVWAYVKRFGVNTVLFGVIFFGGTILLSHFSIENYLTWAIAGAILTVCGGVLVLSANLLVYRSDVIEIFSKGFERVIKKGRKPNVKT